MTSTRHRRIRALLIDEGIAADIADDTAADLIARTHQQHQDAATQFADFFGAQIEARNAQSNPLANIDTEQDPT